MKENILGYAVYSKTITECVDSIFEMLSTGRRRGSWLACMNPHSYAVSLQDARFSRALANADWLVPDGTGVVMASRVLGGSIGSRITGSDIFFTLHERMNSVGGLKVFFLGASEETLGQIRRRMAVDYPNIIVSGTYSPPFSDQYSAGEIEEMISAINEAEPHVLWVGMTAPKQEKWIYENASRMNVRFIAAIGAVFDFYAGKVKRSPVLFQKLGLEWLHRLLQEPRRLWRRTFLSAPIWIFHLMKFRIAGKGNI